jgi:3-carboxy-cis,cis-muconate cycloisomerase
MLEFEAALSEAEAAEGVVPTGAVAPIAAACSAGVDIDAIVAAQNGPGGSAGCAPAHTPPLKFFAVR